MSFWRSWLRESGDGNGTSAGVSGAKLRSWAGWPLLIIPAAAVAFDGCEIGPAGGMMTRHAQVAIVVGLLTLIGWMFLQAFCTTLPDTQRANEKDLLPMVRFSYLFIILCLLGSALPLVFPWVPNHQSLYNSMIRSPIGLVKGCVHESDPGRQNWELACDPTDPFKVQWFINIGGAARVCRRGLPCWSEGAVAIVPDHESPEPLTPAMIKAPTERCIEPNQDAHKAFMYTALKAPIDKCLADDAFAPAGVHGGLAIPWYVISLAILGAIVGLARKVPEYQRRAVDILDSMNGPRMREYLEFQILQVLCAPLIALVAYNLTTPAGLQTSVMLGFASGFASEPVLLAIRSFIDRLTGAQAGEETKPRLTADAIASLAREAAKAAAEKCRIAFDIEAQPLQFPTEPEFAKEFAATLNQRLAAYGMVWIGQLADCAGAKDWTEAASRIRLVSAERRGGIGS